MEFLQSRSDHEVNPILLASHLNPSQRDTSVDSALDLGQKIALVT
jgi:hypothetical protein